MIISVLQSQMDLQKDIDRGKEIWQISPISKYLDRKYGCSLYYFYNVYFVSKVFQNKKLREKCFNKLEIIILPRFELSP